MHGLVSLKLGYDRTAVSISRRDITWLGLGLGWRGITQKMETTVDHHTGNPNPDHLQA